MTAAKKLVREYELVYILRPAVNSAEAKKVSDRVTDVLTREGARLTRVDQWGRRKLAYPIQKHTRGFFVYLRFVGPTEVIAELERNLRIVDDVIRYQTVRLEGLYDLEALEVDPEEVEFREIEATEEEDEDPTFEERLGMRPRDRDRGRGSEEGDDESAEEGDDEDAAAVVPEAAASEATDETTEEEA